MLGVGLAVHCRTTGPSPAAAGWPHGGRGGWTWYTGSAGWMYRLIVESLLGLQRRGDTLRLAPCLPADWPEVALRYRYGDTVYRIRVRQSDDVATQGRLIVDGVAQADGVIRLQDDHGEHVVELVHAQGTHGSGRTAGD